MPTYEYECKSCGHIFEVFQYITAKPLNKCPKCRKSLRRLFGAGAGIIFKGSGFYETDYKRKASSPAACKNESVKGRPAPPPAGGPPPARGLPLLPTGLLEAKTALDFAGSKIVGLKPRAGTASETPGKPGASSAVKNAGPAEKVSSTASKSSDRACPAAAGACSES